MVRALQFTAVGAFVVACLGKSVVPATHSTFGTGHFMLRYGHVSTLSFDPGVRPGLALCRVNPLETCPPPQEAGCKAHKILISRALAR